MSDREINLMDAYPPQAIELQTRLARIIRRMQKIQQSIHASRQPASRMELMELSDLGQEYARIIARLAELSGLDPD